MKKKLSIIIAIALSLSFSMSANAQILWRSAKTMTKGSFITMSHMYYMDYTKKYSNDDWGDNPNDQSNFGFNFMLGYAVTDRWEVMLHAPLAFKSFSSSTMDEDCNSFSDIYFKTRFSLVPWTKDKNGFALIGTLRLPTGSDEEANAFLNQGDSTTDIALGGIFSSKWINKFRNHIKFNYWLNGETDSNVNVGNELKFILKLDNNLHPKFMPFITYIYYKKFENMDSNDNEIAGSDKSRNYFVFGGVIKPKKGFFVRPRFSFHFGGENGVIFDIKPILDIWYVF